MLRSRLGRVLSALPFALLLPLAASAQSGIAGVVRDDSGGVLPGVSVEAASPALIEKVRAVVTDEQGRYAVVDLRPGIYRVTFSLPGFTTLVRDGIDLPANFTATVNADLRIGAIEETLTVTGDAPLVDVQNTQRTTVLKRDLLDAVPTGRTYAQMGALAVGVRVSAQAVGGARTATQQRLLVHGAAPRDNTVSVDGMKMNSMYLGGETQPNHNDAMVQEATVQTNSPGAEVSAGGVVINLIPREGGNLFSGSAFAGYSGSSFQGSNLTPELAARGLQQGDAVDYVYDVNWALGGPIRRDKVWFFFSHRDIGNANVVANSFYPDGRPGLYDQRLYQFTLRLTSQLTPRHKLSAYIDRPIKNVPHDYASGTDVLTAARRRTDVLYYTGSVKWSSIVNSRFMLDAAWGASVNAINFIYQPDVRQERGTPGWFARASRQDIVLGTRTTASVPEQHDYPFLYMLQSSAAYVTGSHSLKTGVQWRYGPYWRHYDANADLVQRYRNGVPDSVIVYNTPTDPRYYLNADLGLYVQDSWKVGRLTVNPGLRLEYFNAQLDATASRPGRFIGYREFPEVPNLPDWFDVAPRFGIVYDLTGDSTTALKFSVNRYNLNDTTNFAARYDAASLQSDTRNWRDVNGDDIAQDHEIGPSNNVQFGAGAARRPDPDIRREYNLEYSAGVDRQLTPNLSVAGAWYRRSYRNLIWADNLLIEPTDYAAFDVANPLGGESITVYNLHRAKQGLVDILDRNGRDSSLRRQTYDGFELAFNARLPRGGTVFGGWSADRTIEVACDGDDPNTYRFCDQSAVGMPFRSDFKLVGAYPLPLDFQVGGAFASYAGFMRTITWTVPANLFPGGRTQSVSVALTPPGSDYGPRWNQLDLSVRKVFRLGGAQLDAALDMFNALNSNVVLSDIQTFGPTLGNPTQILQPRLLRVSANVKF